MPIVYSGGKLITTGFTDPIPCDLEDVYQADVVGGWGVFHKQANNQYASDAPLQIGDGWTPTFFADSGKQIMFTQAAITAHYQWNIYVHNGASFTLGTLINDSAKITTDGCHLLALNSLYAAHLINAATTSAQINLYGCLVQGTDNPMISTLLTIPNGTVYNTIMDKIYMYLTPNCKLYNVAYTSSKSYGLYGSSGDWGSLVLKNNVYGIGFGYSGSGSVAGDQHAKNAIFRNNTFMTNCSFMNVDCSLTNPDVDVWNLSWNNSSANLIIYYEYDLYVQYADNTPYANHRVTIWQREGNNNFTDADRVFIGYTDPDGKIATQTLTMGYFNQTNGNTPIKSYHKLEIQGNTIYPDYVTEFEADNRKSLEISMIVGSGGGGGGLMRNPSMAGGMV